MATLTHNLPAAPDISAFDGSEVDPSQSVVINWAPGNNLGEDCHDPELIDNGTIPDPGTVPVILWEVVVEPDADAVDLELVYSVQVPAGQTSVTVPPEYLNAYSALGVTEFKFEVGAREASGNQTFSEGTFELAEP